MRLFHFSEDAGIARLEPRQATVMSERRAGMEWLNGPVVYAVDDWHQPLHLFPSDCPRILAWPTPRTTEADRQRWFGEGQARMLAFIETTWVERVAAATIHRYELPIEGFESVDGAGLWATRSPVVPIKRATVTDLPAALKGQGVDLRSHERLSRLRTLWSTTLHVAGVRLRSAVGWAGRDDGI